MLEALFGMMYRQADGRDGRPMLLNAYLFIGLGWICYSQFGLEWVALAVHSITLVNILSGYKSFTLPLVVYNYRKVVTFAIHIKHMYIYKCESDREFVLHNLSVLEQVYENTINNLEHRYERDNGFHTWHTCYRFLIPSMAICALTSWNLYWLGATVIAGSLFPLSVKYWNTEESEQLREAILGGVLIGGLLWV